MKKAFSYLREEIGWVRFRISSEGFFLVFFCLQKVHLIFSLEQKLQHHHHHHLIQLPMTTIVHLFWLKVKQIHSIHNGSICK